MSETITYDEWMAELGRLHKPQKLKTNELVRGLAAQGLLRRGASRHGLVGQGRALELLQVYKRPFKGLK